MSGAELIVAALTAGASAGVANVASAAVSDLYTNFRDRLAAFLRGRPSESALHSGAIDDAQHEQLMKDLADSHAADDPHVLSLAQQVLNAYSVNGSVYNVSADNAKGLQVGNLNSQTNNFS